MYQYPKYNRNETSIDIPASCVGVVIGKAGVNINAIKRTLGVKFATVKDNKLVLSGTPDSIEVVKRMVINTQSH